jgi:Methyltransferase domain
MWEQIGVRDPAPAEFWTRSFARALSENPLPRLIDIACGDGAVTGVAVDAAQAARARANIFCADRSFSAAVEIRKRFPQVQAVVCDACGMPYPDGSFDLVVSQFGIEYAGEAAFVEAARLVAAGGRLLAIVHIVGGSLHRECTENLAAVRAVIQSKFVPSAREAFSAGFALIAGKIGGVEFRLHDRRLAVAVEIVKQILGDKGPSALNRFLDRLFRDIGHMYNRMQNYTPDKVLAWLDVMENELAAYEGRMVSMTLCAFDKETINSTARDLSAAGLVVDAPQTLALKESAKPGGWVLSASRPVQPR